MNTKTIKKPTNKAESIWDNQARLKREAREISATHVDKTPIRYLLKR